MLGARTLLFVGELLGDLKASAWDIPLEGRVVYSPVEERERYQPPAPRGFESLETDDWSWEFGADGGEGSAGDEEVSGG